MRKKNHFLNLLRDLFVPLLIVVILLFFFTALSNVQSGSGEEEKKQLEESIRRTAAACYAAEGIYPPTVEYMEEHYGLIVEEEKYVIDYQIFASNLMPTFTVLERTDAPRKGTLRGIWGW